LLKPHRFALNSRKEKASNKINMKTIAVIVLLASATLLRADQAIADVQQALKDQGFYYGEVSGDKNADTTAAIRRFQIRNGLQVTGELNDETLKTLGVGNGAQPATRATPVATPDDSDLRNETREQTAPTRSVQPQPQSPADAETAPPQDRQVYQGKPPPPVSPEGGGLFAGTPYETAPPEMQQNVVASAQSRLARSGLYHGEIDGIYGPNMEFSLRAYQSKVGLRSTGRLDLETLAALELLPGANTPVYTPRRRIFRQPPVHGQWVPE
jgi:peptidoglycan hydrolase-like protein with peptidoglycan-binding domain